MIYKRTNKVLSQKDFYLRSETKILIREQKVNFKEVIALIAIKVNPKNDYNFMEGKKINYKNANPKILMNNKPKDLQKIVSEDNYLNQLKKGYLKLVAKYDFVNIK